MKISWLIFSVLFLPPAHAQSVIGTPLNVPYQTLVEWLTLPAPGKKLLPQHLSEQMLRYIPGEKQDFVRTIKITLLDGSPNHRCALDFFAKTGKTANGNPEILFCVRQFQYIEQLTRVFTYANFNILHNDEYADRRIKIWDNYLLYLRKKRNEDRDSIYTNSTSNFEQFCSAEFYFVVNALGHFGNNCPAAAAEKHAADFRKFYLRGEIIPEKILNGLSAENRTNIPARMTEEANTVNWQAMWFTALLHELGHLLLCHEGTFAGLACKDAVMPATAAQREVDADKFALSAIQQLNKDDVDWIAATQASLIIQSVSRASFEKGEVVSFERIMKNAIFFEELNKMLSQDKDFMEFVKKYLTPPP